MTRTARWPAKAVRYSMKRRRINRKSIRPHLLARFRFGKRRGINIAKRTAIQIDRHHERNYSHESLMSLRQRRGLAAESVASVQSRAGGSGDIVPPVDCGEASAYGPIIPDRAAPESNYVPRLRRFVRQFSDRLRCHAPPIHWIDACTQHSWRSGTKPIPIIELPGARFAVVMVKKEQAVDGRRTRAAEGSPLAPGDFSSLARDPAAGARMPGCGPCATRLSAAGQPLTDFSPYVDGA